MDREEGVDCWGAARQHVTEHRITELCWEFCRPELHSGWTPNASALQRPRFCLRSEFAGGMCVMPGGWGTSPQNAALRKMA